MTDEPKDIAPTSPTSPVVEEGQPVEVEDIANLFKGVIEPIARSQEIAQTEETKRAQIGADIASKFLRYFFGIAFTILIIAVIALFLGKDQLTEKIVFGVIGFIGGYAFGKGTPRSGG